MSRLGPAVRLVKRALVWDLVRYEWTVDESRVRGLAFEMRHDPTQIAILHPSPKSDGGGAWQVSYFDRLGAVGDQRGKTATAALRDVSRRTYRLREVVLAQ